MPNSYQLPVGFGHRSENFSLCTWPDTPPFLQMLCCPLLVKSGPPKALGFAVSSLYNCNINTCCQRAACTLRFWGPQAERRWLAKGKDVPAFFWAPQLTATSSSRPWRWREEKQPWRNPDRSVAVLILERMWCIWLSCKTYFLSSWPNTGGFADQFSWLEHLGITRFWNKRGENHLLQLENTNSSPLATGEHMTHSCSSPEPAAAA